MAQTGEPLSCAYPPLDILVNGRSVTDGDLLFDIRPTVSGVPMDDDSLVLASLTVSKEDIIEPIIGATKEPMVGRLVNCH